MDNNLLIELEKQKDERRSSRLFRGDGQPLKPLADVAADADADVDADADADVDVDVDVEGSVQDRIACRHVVCAFRPPRGSPVTVCRSSSWYR